MKLLLIDAYDSFVYIIYQYLLSLGHHVDVIRNDQQHFETIQQAQYDTIILGPGPGHPKECGYLEVIEHFKNKLPLFGVCLGMQAIAVYFGGEVVKASHLMHGKTSQVEHNNQDCFLNLPNPMTVTRYHSLIAEEKTLAPTLKITARSLDDSYVMGLKHKTLNIEGVQFHPESICTDSGIKIFQNFLDRQNPTF